MSGDARQGDQGDQGDQGVVGLRVRLHYPNLGSFLTGYAENLTQGGILLPGVALVPTDTVVRFELTLDDNTVALRGEGKVAWSRADGTRPGLAVRFVRLDAWSRTLVDHLAETGRISSQTLPPMRAATLSVGPPRPSRPAPESIRVSPSEIDLVRQASRVPTAPLKPTLADLDRALDALAGELIRELPALPALPVRSVAALDAALDALAAEHGVPVSMVIPRAPAVPATPAPATLRVPVTEVAPVAPVAPAPVAPAPVAPAPVAPAPVAPAPVAPAPAVMESVAAPVEVPLAVLPDMPSQVPLSLGAWEGSRDADGLDVEQPLALPQAVFTPVAVATDAVEPLPELPSFEDASLTAAPTPLPVPVVPTPVPAPVVPTPAPDAPADDLFPADLWDEAMVVAPEDPHRATASVHRRDAEPVVPVALVTLPPVPSAMPLVMEEEPTAEPPPVAVLAASPTTASEVGLFPSESGDRGGYGLEIDLTDFGPMDPLAPLPPVTDPPVASARATPRTYAVPMEPAPVSLEDLLDDAEAIELDAGEIEDLRPSEVETPGVQAHPVAHMPDIPDAAVRHRVAPPPVPGAPPRQPLPVALEPEETVEPERP